MPSVVENIELVAAGSARSGRIGLTNKEKRGEGSAEAGKGGGEGMPDVFEPIRINGMELGNRFMSSATLWQLMGRSQMREGPLRCRQDSP